MSRLRLLLAALIPLLLIQGAGAEGLVSTLSDDAVQITSNFAGERIVVFGAVQNPSGDASKYQVAVVVQGPEQEVTVRRKGRILGVWANVASRPFSSVPSFFRIFAPFSGNVKILNLGGSTRIAWAKIACRYISTPNISLYFS